MRSKCRVLLPVDRNERVETILSQIVVTGGDRGLVVVAATMLRHAGLTGHLGAAVVFARDEVHDARDGIAAVDRRCPIPQNFDTIDRC